MHQSSAMARAMPTTPSPSRLASRKDVRTASPCFLFYQKPRDFTNPSGEKTLPAHRGFPPNGPEVFIGLKINAYRFL